MPFQTPGATAVQVNDWANAAHPIQKRKKLVQINHQIKKEDYNEQSQEEKFLKRNSNIIRKKTLDIIEQ